MKGFGGYGGAAAGLLKGGGPGAGRGGCGAPPSPRRTAESEGNWDMMSIAAALDASPNVPPLDYEVGAPLLLSLASSERQRLGKAGEERVAEERSAERAYMSRNCTATQKYPFECPCDVTPGLRHSYLRACRALSRKTLSNVASPLFWSRGSKATFSRKTLRHVLTWE